MAELGPFTVWLKKWREVHDLPLSPELAEKLAAEVFTMLQRILAQAGKGRYGHDAAEDLVSAQVLVMLERLTDRDRLLPTFVTDTKSLFLWMYREIWSKLCRALASEKSAIRGLSSLPRTAEGEVDLLGMENLEQVKPLLDKLGLEMQEILKKAMAELKKWQGQEWVNAFEAVYLKERTQREEAERMGVPEEQVSRRLQQGKFCLAQELGWTEVEQIEEFGEVNVRRWSMALAELGKAGE